MKFDFFLKKYGFLPFIFMMALFTFLVFLAVEYQERQELIAESEEAVIREVEFVNSMMQDALLKGDYVAVERFLHFWGEKRKDLVTAELRTLDGFVVASYARNNKASHPGNYLQEITYGDDSILVLELTIDLDERYDGYYQQTFGVLIIILLLFSSFGVLLWKVLQKTAIEPLQNEVKLREYSEQQLMLARNDAVRANHAKSEFLSRMSHELRTPLNAILGFAQLLEMRLKNEENIAHNEEIISAGRHLLQLINEILNLSRIEAGKVHVELEPLQVSRITQECLQMTAGLLENSNIRINSLVKQEQDCTVMADEMRLREILLNLVSNAIKYNRPGGEVTIECEALPDNKVRIAVKDTGPGMTDEQVRQLFTPFTRFVSNPDEVEGTGIGLVISRNLVELMNGEIGVDSEPGKGSCFWVILPQA